MELGMPAHVALMWLCCFVTSPAVLIPSYVCKRVTNQHVQNYKDSYTNLLSQWLSGHRAWKR